MPVQSRDYGSILYNHYLWCLDQGRDTSWWHKDQASSIKHQASSTKSLDKSLAMGYSRTITDGNARHAQLNASPSRIPGISGRQTHSKTDVSLPQEQSGRRHLPGIKTSSNKRQAASIKHQAVPGNKHTVQGPGTRHQALCHGQQAPRSSNQGTSAPQHVSLTSDQGSEL